MIALRLARAAVLAGAGTVVTLAQLNLPRSGFWEAHVRWQWASVILLAGFICYDGVRSVNHAVQASRLREYDRDLRAALSAVVAVVAETTGAPWDELAVRYYRRRGVLTWRRLFQVGAVMAGADLVDAKHPVRPGVGVVGSAFSGQELLGVSWREFVRVATDEGVAAWDRRPAAERYGLSWGQLRRSEQPMGLVASPTFARSGRPDGCLVVSGTLKPPDLTNPAVRSALDDCSRVLDLLGKPPKGWWSVHGR